jgi:hypothetical protein
MHVKVRTASRDDAVGEILRHSYAAFTPTRSISYGVIGSYPAKEAVMPGVTVCSMVRFGISRSRNDIARTGSPVAPAAPRVGEVVFEIGLVLALHLAFAVGVLLTLNAYGAA